MLEHKGHEGHRVRRLKCLCVLCVLCVLGLGSVGTPTLAQTPATIDGRPALTIANDRLTLGVRTDGGAMVRLVLNDDPAAVHPLHTGLGHFVCVDGVGPVS